MWRKLSLTQVCSWKKATSQTPGGSPDHSVKTAPWVLTTCPRLDQQENREQAQHSHSANKEIEAKRHWGFSSRSDHFIIQEVKQMLDINKRACRAWVGTGPDVVLIVWWEFLNSERRVLCLHCSLKPPELWERNTELNFEDPKTSDVPGERDF
jgi:hypothetical protein